MLEFIQSLSLLEQITYGTLLLTLLYQIVVWLGFSAIATHRHHSRLKKGDPLPAISIVVVVTESSKWFIEDGLNELLTQDYDGEWEVVVVNDWGGVEVTNELELMAATNSRLRFTELKKNPKFPHSRKIPLMLGIKAANYPNLLFSDPTVSPRSNKWLKIMSGGFIGSSAVIGYTGFRPGTSGFIRSSRLMSSIRYLNAAVAESPYRGIYNNMGYTKDFFFSSKGFTHLRLATGEDDLFLQRASKGQDVSVILNPLCTAEQYPSGGLWWWWNEQRYRTFSYKYYPASVRIKIFVELLTKALFFAAVALCIISSLAWDGWQWGYIVGGVAWLLRTFVMMRTLGRICKRLGEKRLALPFMLYDLLNPITETLLSISRRVKVNQELWK